MTFENPQRESSLATAREAIAIACGQKAGSWSALTLEQRALAIATAQKIDARLGIVGLALEAESFDRLPELLADSTWLCACAPTERGLDDLRCHLAQAYAQRPGAATAISQADPATMWLGALTLAYPAAASPHPDKHSLFFNLAQTKLRDSRGEPKPFSYHAAPGGEHAAPDMDWTRYAEGIVFAAKASEPELFERMPALKKAAAGAASAGLALDSGILGAGAPKASRAALEASAFLFQNGGDSQELRSLLLLWAASARGHSAEAFALAKEHMPAVPLLARDWCGLATDELRASPFAIPEWIDPAWVCASKTFDPRGLHATRLLAELLPRSASPTYSLSKLGAWAEHPLKGMFDLWGHALKAGVPLPASATQAMLSKFEKEAKIFEPDWKPIVEGWRALATQAQEAILRGAPFPDQFPGGPLEDIRALEKRDYPASPLQWRLTHREGTIATWNAGLGSPESIRHCALASSALGYPIADTLSKIQRSLSTEEKAGLEAALFEESTISPTAQASKASRL
jgi:hypothetical protein